VPAFRATGELLPARWVDAGLVLALLAMVVASSLEQRWSLPAYLLTTAQIVLLWWRREHPLPVVAAQLAVALVARGAPGVGGLFGDRPGDAWLGPEGVAHLAVVAGIYTVGSRRGLRSGALAVVADLLISCATVVAVGAPPGLLLGQLVRDTQALVAGLYVGMRRAYVDRLRERADQIERERRLEARAAVHEERRRIARELHDVVAHHVAVMTLHAGAVERRLLAAGADDDTRDSAAAIRRTGQEAMTELRRLLVVLRAGPGHDREPQPDLDRVEDLVVRMREAGLPVTLRREGRARAVSAGVSLAAYRIVQEALTNTLRHAGPVPSEVTIVLTDDAVQVRVDDAGRRVAACS
jgi:signal transduction histidine kinase